MSVAGLFTAIEAHLTAAGAAQTPPITQVLSGEPDALSNYPVLAYWYIGNRPWVANTLSQTQRELGVHVIAYFPGTIRSLATSRTLELQVASIALALEAEFMADVTMGGNATGQGLEITDPTPGWAMVGPVLARVVDFDIWFQLSNVAPISA